MYWFVVCVPTWQYRVDTHNNEQQQNAIKIIRIIRGNHGGIVCPSSWYLGAQLNFFGAFLPFALVCFWRWMTFMMLKWHTQTKKGVALQPQELFE